MRTNREFIEVVRSIFSGEELSCRVWSDLRATYRRVKFQPLYSSNGARMRILAEVRRLVAASGAYVELSWQLYDHCYYLELVIYRYSGNPSGTIKLAKRFRYKLDMARALKTVRAAEFKKKAKLFDDFREDLIITAGRRAALAGLTLKCGEYEGNWNARSFTVTVYQS